MLAFLHRNGICDHSGIFHSSTVFHQEEVPRLEDSCLFSAFCYVLFCEIVDLEETSESR